MRVRRSLGMVCTHLQYDVILKHKVHLVRARAGTGDRLPDPDVTQRAAQYTPATHTSTPSAPPLQQRHTTMEGCTHRRYAWSWCGFMAPPYLPRIPGYQRQHKARSRHASYCRRPQGLEHLPPRGQVEGTQDRWGREVDLFACTCTSSGRSFRLRCCLDSTMQL